MNIRLVFFLSLATSSSPFSLVGGEGGVIGKLFDDLLRKNNISLA